ncbi:short-chain dehydrogenase [Terrimonas sp. NA20]|uniref:Short-chain dehydrogenase n=1 Tax=Terrimonas ginsenosidimutans TaxID=2908004 RepID=A0ABS9KTY1_9BACT|nr:short-chain dehydrogenase [Terrimonas ginsenosidimutans]MCG2615784.1 short-chain dehydrogenase [Terrimonas ginsenosidimutans]
MNNEDIEKFLKTKMKKNTPVRINFKTRKPFLGLFIEEPDYGELSRKNLWRIVSETKFDEFSSSGNTDLARIFNGAEFTKLEATGTK